MSYLSSGRLRTVITINDDYHERFHDSPFLLELKIVLINEKVMY